MDQPAVDRPARTAVGPVSETCNYCDARIRWVTTTRDVRMPLDARPDADRGNVLVLTSGAGVLNDGQAAAARARGVELYLHHAVTCPFASRWNKGAEAVRR